MFTITVSEDEVYEMNHFRACDFLEFLGINGMQACRDAEDFGDASYHGNNVHVFIEFHA